jgi:hypothetical protein
MRGGVQYYTFDILEKDKFYNLFKCIFANDDLKSRQDVSDIMENINIQIRKIKNEDLDRTLDRSEAQQIIKNYIIANVQPQDKTHLSAIQVMLPTYKPPLNEETISSNLVKAYNKAMENTSAWWRNEATVKALVLIW